VTSELFFVMVSRCQLSTVHIQDLSINGMSIDDVNFAYLLTIDIKCMTDLLENEWKNTKATTMSYSMFSNQQGSTSFDLDPLDKVALNSLLFHSLRQ
jgi:hypothetical protein